MGGNHSTQIAEAITERSISAAVSASFENIQRNTNLAKMSQDVEIVQTGGLFQTANVGQTQNARLKISAFADSNVQSALAADILSKLTAELSNSGVEPGPLSGILNDTTITTTVKDVVKSSIDVGLKLVSEQVSQNTADIAQKAAIQQSVASGSFTFLQSANVNQDQSYDSFISTTSKAMMNSAVEQKISATVDAQLSQKLSGPLDAIAEAAKQGLWAVLLTILAPFLIVIIIVIIIGALIVGSGVLRGSAEPFEWPEGL